MTEAEVVQRDLSEVQIDADDKAAPTSDDWSIIEELGVAAGCPA